MAEQSKVEPVWRGAGNRNPATQQVEEDNSR